MSGRRACALFTPLPPLFKMHTPGVYGLSGDSAVRMRGTVAQSIVSRFCPVTLFFPMSRDSGHVVWCSCRRTSHAQYHCRTILTTRRTSPRPVHDSRDPINTCSCFSTGALDILVAVNSPAPGEGNQTTQRLRDWEGGVSSNLFVFYRCKGFFDNQCAFSDLTKGRDGITEHDATSVTVAEGRALAVIFYILRVS